MKHPIYLTILLLLTAIVVALPFIKVPISVSARGVIRSNFENSELTAPVSGRVVKCFLSQNNQSIQKGDTLLVITTELLDTQRQLVNTQQQDYNAQLVTRPYYFSLSQKYPPTNTTICPRKSRFFRKNRSVASPIIFS